MGKDDRAKQLIYRAGEIAFSDFFALLGWFFLFPSDERARAVRARHFASKILDRNP